MNEFFENEQVRRMEKQRLGEERPIFPNVEDDEEEEEDEENDEDDWDDAEDELEESIEEDRKSE